MRNLKRLAASLVAMALLVAFSSCEKQPAANDDLVEVSFDINNPSLNGDLSKKGGDDGSNQDYPICSDAEPDHVKLTIDNTPYVLDIVNVNLGTETEVIKLPAGPHTISSFIVCDADGNPIWASPTNNSTYAQDWNLVGVELRFDTEDFQKKKVLIDVLCYEPYNYEDFGFNWFEFAPIEIRTVCFFANVCTKFFDEWHEAQGSPYNGQEYDGYNFAGILEVEITDGEGNPLSDGTNASYKGVGSPLCIEIPDFVNSDDDYIANIYLVLPDNSRVLIDSVEFGDDEIDGFGGTDGVFDIAIGDCAVADDGKYPLPWMPMPQSGVMKVDFDQSLGTYTRVTFLQIDNDSHPDSKLNVLTPGWCAASNWGIWGSNYPVNFFSSLSPNSMPPYLKNINWDTLNWLANNIDEVRSRAGMTVEKIQNAIWHFTNGNGATTLSTEMGASGNEYIIPLGGYAFVAADPNVNGDPNSDKIDGIQVMIVRVDP